MKSAKKRATKETRTPNVRRERFCEIVAAGVVPADAWIQAGYKVSREVARRNAHEALTNPDVKARVAEIRAEASKRSEFKKDDLVRFLASVITTPVGEVGIDSPLCQEFTEDRIAGGARGKLRRGNAPRGNEIDTPDIIRRRVKIPGKIEAGRLLADLLGWKEPEKTEVDYGARTLDAIRERAREAASPLARVPR